ncbi:hypothetical protein SK128_010168 [Halocaridina rubra]|uniref:Uncharacterized protein n=1 Tax=Halocaridina rubra TaxID=373956 RepID=A0AAN8WEJ3_HALRR
MTEKMSLYDLIEDPWIFLDLVEEPFGDNAAHSDQNCFGYSTSNYQYDDINIIHPIGEQPPDIILQDAPTSTTDVQVEQQQQYEQQQLLQQHSSTTDVQVEQQQQYEQQPLVIPLEQQYEQQEMLQQPSSTTDLQVDQQQYEQHQQLPLHNGHQRILLVS